MIVSNGETLNFAPQALGETVPSLASGYFYGSTGLDLAGKHATYAALYRSQPSVATVVDKVANSAARLGFKVWDVTDEGGKTEDTDSAFAKLMARPNNRMSVYSFWRWTFSTLDIYGEAFWFKQRDSFGQIFNLVPMHPSRTAVKRDHEGNLTYIFTLGVASAGILTVPESEVVAFLRYNPDSLMRGLSRLEPLRSTLLNEDAARRATSSWWSRGARPSVVLKHPGTLSQPAQDRLKASFDARHAGADNAGATAVLEEGMEAQIVQLNAEEMQYIETRKLNLQEVCMVYDVPPPVVHVLDHATYSNITEQMRSMYRDTMSPRLEEIESVIDASLRTEFYDAGKRMAKFSLDEVLRGDFETRAQAAIGMVAGGIMKPAEARKLFDLPALGGASDVLYGNGGLVELGSSPAAATAINIHNGSDGSQKPEVAPGAASTAATDTQDGSAASNASKGIEAGNPKGSPLTVRSIMGRLSRKSTQPAIREQLAKEHKTAMADFLAKQQASAKANGYLNPVDWHEELGNTLHTLATATAQAIGKKVATDLGGNFEASTLDKQLKKNSYAAAEKINTVTAKQVADAMAALDQIDDPDPDQMIDDTFDGPIASRRDQISLTRVAIVAGITALAAAAASNAVTKTWVVTNPNPRPEHAKLDGETVKLDEDFSNGLSGPGHFADGDAGEVANCDCYLDFGL